MTEQDLFHKTLSSDKSLIDLIDNTACRPKDWGQGDTTYTVGLMAQMVRDTLSHTKRLANELRRRHGNDIPAIHKALNDFLWQNYKYAMDSDFQDVRSPGCAKSSRHTGIDCKGVSITASSVLMNLGIPHSIRQVKKIHDRPDEFTHVYVVIHHKGEILAVDGTTNIYDEQPIREADDYFMNHRGLHKPQTTNKKLAKQASFHGRKLRVGNKLEQGISGSWLASYRHGLGLPAVEYPKFLNELEANIVLIQNIMAKYATMGGNARVINRFLSDLRTLIENNERVINVRIEDHTPYINNVPYPIFEGLGFSLDFLNLGNLFGAGEQTAPGDNPSGNDGSGTNFSDFTGGGSSSDGSAIADIAGNLLDSGFITQAVGAVFSNGLDFSCWGSSNNPSRSRDQAEQDFKGFLAESGIQRNVNTQTFNKFYFLTELYIAMRAYGERNGDLAGCTKKGNAQGLKDMRKYQGETIERLRQAYDIVPTGTRSNVNHPEVRLSSDYANGKMRYDSRWRKDDIKVWTVTPKQATPDPVDFTGIGQTGILPVNGNQPPANQNPPKKTGISTTTAAVGGLGLLGGIGLLMWYFGQQNDAPKKSKTA